MGILSHTPIHNLDAEDPLAYHLQIEAMELDLVDVETYLSDGDHMINVTSEVFLDEQK